VDLVNPATYLRHAQRLLQISFRLLQIQQFVFFDFLPPLLDPIVLSEIAEQ
jgi:hypothetical protein